MRLLIGGYNSYVTEEGYLFAVPRASSVYVPVITGTYRPPFPASYVGYAADYRREQMQQIDDKIAELEREKYPLYRRELKNDENIRSLRRMLIKKEMVRIFGVLRRAGAGTPQAQGAVTPQISL